MRVLNTIIGALLIATNVLGQSNTSCITKNIYELNPFDGPLVNPHKGFTFPTYSDWSLSPSWEYGPGGSKNNQAWNVISHGSGYLRWDKLNPEKGVYNWNDLENLLNNHAKQGLTFALRVFPYSTSKGAKNHYTIEQDYDWTPRFVYYQGARKNYATITDNGTQYTIAVPVWDDPVYLQAHKDFAAALAQKYDGDPRIEYIDIRCFGNWGEWHVAHMNGAQMASVQAQKDMLSYYASIFHKTLLVLPSSGEGEVYKHALSLGITKRDDGLIGTPNREETLIPAYEANLPTVAENISTYSVMLGYNDVIPGGYLRWTLDRWKNVINVAHLTYYVLDQDSDAGYRFYTENKVHVDSMTKVIGYNFRLSHAELTTVADPNSTTHTLNIKVDNTGVAPCFFDVYIVAELVDNYGNVLTQLGQTIFIPKGTFKDGMSKEYEFSYTAPSWQTNLATQKNISVSLALYESEDAYRKGKNPTVRFDNNGLQENNKLLLQSCSHEFGKWETIKQPTNTKNGMRRRVCTKEHCESYEEEIIPSWNSGLKAVKSNGDDNVAFAIGNTIYVTNALGKSVSLYNSIGELCDKRNADTEELQLTVQHKGLYFVIIENQQYRVLVK